LRITSGGSLVEGAIRLGAGGKPPRAIVRPSRPGAINTLLGRSSSPKPRDEDTEKEKEPEPETTGSTETTSGLLAAKRRARKRLDRDMRE
jgi:hypothetical protein